jgi:hypothetical protein
VIFLSFLSNGLVALRAALCYPSTNPLRAAVVAERGATPRREACLLRGVPLYRDPARDFYLWLRLQ